MYPFERFSQYAKTVLTVAQEEAEHAHHSYIGTEHLLLGLMRAEGCSAAVALDSLGVKIGEVRERIAIVLGDGERILIQQIIPTSRVKKVIEIAFEEARTRGRNYVGTDHILLALMLEGEGIACHVLADLGVTVERLEEAVAGVGRSEEASAPPAPSLPAGSRVLVHEAEPPHRLWEGVVEVQGSVTVRIRVDGRPAGEQMEVAPEFLHRIPGPGTHGCAYCRAQANP